jgi:hypothetical protein
MGIAEETLQIIHSLAKARDFTIAERPKNIAAFIKLCYSPSYTDDVADVVESLEIGDCTKGPEPDEDGYEGEVYIFNKLIKGLSIYIKLRVLEQDGMTYMSVISFHN